MRWVTAPLVAALLFLGSGWLDALERTTELSARLAETSEDAPEETRAAAESVESLPTIAKLTRQQADGFRALVDALEISAQRVRDLNSSIEEQERSLDLLRVALDKFTGPVECVERRLERLAAATGGIPGSLTAIETTIGQLTGQQERSIRHLKSINRKMTALGVVATASDVKPPKPPPEAGEPEPGDPRSGEPCQPG